MRDCGSSSFIPISYSSFFHCGSAGAVVLSPFHIHPFSTAGVRDCGSNSFSPIPYSSFFHCGSTGLREQWFYPHFIFILFPLQECGTAGAAVLPPFHVLSFSTAGVRDCGSSSFTPVSYTFFFHCGSAGLRDCGSSSFIPISYTCFFHCRSAGLREQQFYPHFIYLLFPLRECGTAGAAVLPPFHIPFHILAFSTAGLREQ